MVLFSSALHPHLSDLAVVGIRKIVLTFWKVRLIQLPEIFLTPRHPRPFQRNGAAAKDVPLSVHGARDVDMLASRDGNPDGLVESALLEGKFGTIILRTVGVWATLPGEVFVAVGLVVFEREGFRLPLGS